MQLKILKNSFEDICEHYLDLSNGDVMLAKEHLRERLWDDIHHSSLQLIEQIIQEKNLISEKPRENDEMVNNYFKEIKNG